MSPTSQLKSLRVVSSDSKKAAIRAFFKISEKWDLNNNEMIALLGYPTEATFYNWKKGVIRNVPHDTLERISIVLGIFKALEILYIQPELADKWMKKPNSYFAGQSAMERMLAGSISDMALVRSYLDSVRGGW